MGIAKNLDSDAPSWAQQLFDEIAELREAIATSNGTATLLVGTAEAAIMLSITPNTLRTWHNEGKMPVNLGKGKHIKYERAAIERMAKAKKTGRPRKA